MRLYPGTKVSRSFVGDSPGIGSLDEIFSALLNTECRSLSTTIFLSILKKVNIYFNDEFIELYIGLEYLPQKGKSFQSCRTDP